MKNFKHNEDKITEISQGGNYLQLISRKQEQQPHGFPESLKRSNFLSF